MCGIIGFVGEGDPKSILLDGLKRLEYRGYDSAGVAVLENNGIQLYRSEGKLNNLEARIADKVFDGHLGIGHTRWATHGAPVENNAHPHRVGDIALVHNGIIENYQELRATLEQSGRTFSTDTDTEIVAHLLDVEIENGKTLEEAVSLVVPRLRGTYAFAIMSERNPNKILGVKKGAPLLVGIGKGGYFLASDVQAVLSHTDQVVYLKDGEFAQCSLDGLKIEDGTGSTISPEVKTVNWSPDQLDKLGYRHYMLKEIHEQPQAIAHTIEGNVDHVKGHVSLKQLTFTQEQLRNVSKITLIACGTAKHAAMVGKHLIERFAKIPVDVDFASEFRYRNPILDKTTLTLAISQSGETADTLAALQSVQPSGSPTLSIVNVRESSLARDSDCVLYTNAGPEIGVASTKAFTTQLTLVYMLAIELGLLRGSLSKEAASALSQDLLQLPILAEKTLELEKEIETLAPDLSEMKRFFYLGRGNLFPIALEGALKLKEISYLHAEGYPAGELKHGPIALVDRHMAAFFIAPKEKPSALNPKPDQLLYDKVMANVQEVKARGGKIIGIGSEDDTSFEKECWFYSGLPTLTWGIAPIIASIPLQLFAYHVALQRGTDVDKPRNLAKSVTVE